MQVKLYKACSNFFNLAQTSDRISLNSILNEAVTEQGARTLLFDLPGARSFLPTARAHYLELMTRRPNIIDFSQPGKCIVYTGYVRRARLLVSLHFVRTARHDSRRLGALHVCRNTLTCTTRNNRYS